MLPAPPGGLDVYEISQETNADLDEVEALYDLAFAPGREALSSYRYRVGITSVLRLCLVARDDLGILAGAIRYWPVRIAHHEALLLGPIAVHPTRQGEGLGALLMAESLSRAGRDARVLLVGDLAYYGRFGFRRLNGVRMPPPTNPDRVLGIGSWEGVAGDVSRAE